MEKQAILNQIAAYSNVFEPKALSSKMYTAKKAKLDTIYDLVGADELAIDTAQAYVFELILDSLEYL